MVANEYLLQIMSLRIEFWRAQLQGAFRTGDAQRIAECTRLLEEYGLLTTKSVCGQLEAHSQPKADQSAS